MSTIYELIGVMEARAKAADARFRFAAREGGHMPDAHYNAGLAAGLRRTIKLLNDHTAERVRGCICGDGFEKVPLDETLYYVPEEGK